MLKDFYKVSLTNGKFFFIAVDGNGVDFQIAAPCYGFASLGNFDFKGVDKPERLNSKYILDVMYHGMIFESGYKNDFAAGIGELMIDFSLLLSKSKMKLPCFNFICEKEFKPNLKRISRKEYLKAAKGGFSK